MQVKGWLASINKEKDAFRQIAGYRELAKLFKIHSTHHMTLFDELAVVRFNDLRAAKIRVGTSDLKIASVALSRDALLLTANRRDFERIPGLRFANWLD